MRFGNPGTAVHCYGGSVRRLISGEEFQEFRSTHCGATLLVNMRDIEPRKEDDGFDGAFLSP